MIKKKTHEQFLEDLILKSDGYTNKEFEIASKYECSQCKMLVRTKYGFCEVRPSNLPSRNPSIRSAVNPTEYFINQAREVHGDKYDYSLVEYKSSHNKVKIISEFGIFEQTPNSHLNGNGCPIEGHNKTAHCNKINPKGWSHAIWEAAAKRSKNFTGYKVYIIECWDTESEERFFKVGKTYRDVEGRFYGKKSMPYSYNILKVVSLTSAREVCELERFYKFENKEFLYKPLKKFDGMNECFSELKNI